MSLPIPVQAVLPRAREASSSAFALFEILSKDMVFIDPVMIGIDPDGDSVSLCPVENDAAGGRCFGSSKVEEMMADI
jgi:hypothetical protein